MHKLVPLAAFKVVSLAILYAGASRAPGISGLATNRSPYSLLPQAFQAAPVAFRLLGAKRTLRYGYGSCPPRTCWILFLVTPDSKIRTIFTKNQKNNARNPPEEPYKHFLLASFQCHRFLTAEHFLEILSRWL